MAQRIGCQFDLQGGEATFRVNKRSLDQRFYLLLRERAQGEDSSARQERGVHLKGRVLRGRTDECDGPALHVRQNGVLLALVETVDLVNKKDGAFAPELGNAGLLDDSPEIGNAG